LTITTANVKQYIGENLYDDEGNKIGHIGGIFLDDGTGEPEWITVSTGFFGTHESFVPIEDATTHSEGLAVPYSKEKVKNAPNVDADRGHLSTEEESTLYAYYDRAHVASTPETRVADEAAEVDDYPSDRESNGPVDEEIVGADQVIVVAEPVAEGRARLRKWVETEEAEVRASEARANEEPVSEVPVSEVPVSGEPRVVETAPPVERMRLVKNPDEEGPTNQG
jgi:hypothetical protein